MRHSEALRSLDINQKIDFAVLSNDPQFIDGLTPLHIQFQRRFSEIKGKATSCANDGFACLFPELKESSLLYKTIWKDLHDQGLIDSDEPVPTPDKGTITIEVSELGLRLLRLISDPQ